MDEIQRNSIPPVILLRRALVPLQVGDVRKFKLGRIPLVSAEREITTFFKSKKLEIDLKIDQDNNAVTLTVIGLSPAEKVRQAIDAASTGDIITLDIPPQSHQIARATANAYARTKGLRASVRTQDDGSLAVYLQDPNNQSDIPNPATGPQKKYDFSDIQEGYPKLFEVMQKDHQNIRNCASHYASRHGIRLSCSALSNGNMVVSRISNDAPPTRRGPKTDSNKYGFADLDEGETARLDGRQYRYETIRAAANRFSNEHGVRLSCAKGIDGSILVKRLRPREQPLYLTIREENKSAQQSPVNVSFPFETLTEVGSSFFVKEDGSFDVPTLMQHRDWYEELLDMTFKIRRVKDPEPGFQVIRFK